jgi:hypothetical protein
MLQLSFEEVRELRCSRSQIATLKQGQNVKYAPYAFTEHCAVMLASVLNSPTAIDASIQVVRAFMRLRAMVSVHEGTGAETHRARTEIRQTVSRRVRSDPGLDDAGAEAVARADRIPRNGRPDAGGRTA